MRVDTFQVTYTAAQEFQVSPEEAPCVVRILKPSLRCYFGDWIRLSSVVPASTLSELDS